MTGLQGLRSGDSALRLSLVKILSCFLTLICFVSAARAEPLPLLWVSLVLEEPTPATLALETETRDGNVMVHVDKTPLLTQADVQGAEIIPGDEPQLKVTLTEAGGSKFAGATEKYLNHKLAIITCDHLLVAPMVRAVITGGSFTISGNFREGEIQSLADALNKK